MLLQHIYEHSGVLLLVDYDPEEPIAIHKVQVLDQEYKPTGPDLTHMLEEMLVLTDSTKETPEAARFLSLVTEEIHEHSAVTAGG
jgi:hypothetical protein